jgi:hypothetical protein
MNVLTKSTRSPLITKINKPKVTTVKGKVKRSKIGFIKVFTIPSPIETIIAVKKLSMVIPGRRYPATKTANPFIKRFNINFIF